MTLKIGNFEFNSRLFLGTGKYRNFEEQKGAVEASDTEVLTFAVRRMNIFDDNQPDLLESLDLTKYKLLPNTAGANTAEEASELYGEGASYVMMPHYIGSEKISNFIKRNGFNKSEFKAFREKHLAYLQTHYTSSAPSS